MSCVGCFPRYGNGNGELTSNGQPNPIAPCPGAGSFKVGISLVQGEGALSMFILVQAT